MGKKFTEDRVVRLSKKKEQLLNEEQYAEYLKRLKAQDEKSYLGTMSLKQRMRYHGLLRFLLRADRMSKGIKVRKLNTQMPNVPEDRQVIFVLTHVGRDDISIFNEVIGEHYTILSGDYESLHNNLQGFVIALNGTVFFNMKSKEERSSIEDRVVEVLKDGDNILCSMEAAWNLSANEIVMELFPGMLRAALRSNAVIVPVDIERFSYRLYGINVAPKAFDVNEYITRYQDAGQAIEIAREDLRQIMADLKFQTYFEDYIQKKITTSREEIGDFETYEKWFKADVLAKETGCEIVPTILHYDEVGKKRCFAHRGKAFRVKELDDIFAKKDELVHIMTNMYWGLMEKYSQYSRVDLEKEGKKLKQNWEELKEQLRSACDIERIGYRLDLADEKRIGKVKNIH